MRTIAIYAAAGMISVAASASIGCFLATGSNRSLSSVPPGLAASVKTAWKEIGGSQSRCGEYDYFPGGGMRNMYCHILNFMNYGQFAELIGLPVFVSGPHSARELNLSSPDQFGHYNREFVNRLGSVLIPGESDAVFRAATQGTYDAHLRKLARIFYVTYRKLKANQSFMEREKTNYLGMIRLRTLDHYHYEKYFYFMNPDYPGGGHGESYLMDHGFDGGWDGNVVKTCVAFWIRRSIDGTAEDFFNGLEKLLRTYDGTFLASGGTVEDREGKNTMHQ